MISDCPQCRINTAHSQGDPGTLLETVSDSQFELDPRGYGFVDAIPRAYFCACSQAPAQINHVK